jgi:hypothetical protein
MSGVFVYRKEARPSAAVAQELPGLAPNTKWLHHPHYFLYSAPHFL